MKYTITGLVEAQRANQQAIAATSPNGGLGRAVSHGTIEAQRYAIAITHVDTGSLQLAHRVSVNGTRGTVFLDPNAPALARRATSANATRVFYRRSVSLSKTKPSVYGVHEHRRGFPHNFYERTVNERGARIASEAIQQVERALPHH